ncbi:hypothetical protein [Kaustia mangrovi]|nr:hypothetical protein [Kaustia mangrovi]
MTNAVENFRFSAPNAGDRAALDAAYKLARAEASEKWAASIGLA